MALCPFIWESLSINRQLDLLHFSAIRLGEKGPLSLQELQFVLLDTDRSIRLLYIKVKKNISYISKLTSMKNNHNFKFNILSL